MSTFSIDDIRAARTRISAHTVRTPVLSSPMLDKLLGCEIFVKAESLQKTGSFKFRGALNKLSQLSVEERKRGVVAFSSGNHGHGVAAAAAKVGTSAVIVLPTNAAPAKVEACRWWGAEIVMYDQATQKREDVARPYFEDRRMTLISPFDDHQIMAGQGTAGLELCEQMEELGLTLDAVVTPSSGGGLSSGVMTAVRFSFPLVECFVSEPAGYDKMARSLALGSRTSNDHEARTVMDALIGRLVGERTFPVLKSLGAQAVSVSDAEVLEAVYAAFRYFKLVVEPGGAAALAAVLTGRIKLPGKRIAVLCSGGNIEDGLFSDVIAAGARRGPESFHSVSMSA